MWRFGKKEEEYLREAHSIIIMLWVFSVEQWKNANTMTISLEKEKITDCLMVSDGEEVLINELSH